MCVIYSMYHAECASLSSVYNMKSAYVVAEIDTWSLPRIATPLTQRSCYTQVVGEPSTNVQVHSATFVTDDPTMLSARARVPHANALSG